MARQRRNKPDQARICDLWGVQGDHRGENFDIFSLKKLIIFNQSRNSKDVPRKYFKNLNEFDKELLWKFSVLVAWGRDEK